MVAWFTVVRIRISAALVQKVHVQIFAHMANVQTAYMPFAHISYYMQHTHVHVQTCVCKGQ